MYTASGTGRKTVSALRQPVIFGEGWRSPEAGIGQRVRVNRTVRRSSTATDMSPHMSISSL